jgi:hypothetical protein
LDFADIARNSMELAASGGWSCRFRACRRVAGGGAGLTAGAGGPGVPKSGIRGLSRGFAGRALIGKEEWQGEYYWRELQAVLELGGVFMEDGAFCTPYLACIDVPGCPECDPFETVYVTRADAVARVEPDANAEVAAKLSWDVLQLDYETAGAEGWYPVKLPDRRTAFLSSRDSRMAVDYRARFEKTAEGWRMTVFIAGD